MTAAMIVLAFTLLQPPPSPPVPAAIPPEVEQVQRENGVKPLLVPDRGTDPVAAGLIPADMAAEEARVRDEIDRGSKAIVERVVGPTTEPAKLWKGGDLIGVPDVTQTSPPEPCTTDLEGWRYVDMAVRAVCVCAKKRWCPEGKMPKTPCTGSATTCQVTR